ncbi:hypothetical protein [Azospirillum sp. sgz302134]
MGRVRSLEGAATLAHLRDAHHGLPVLFHCIACGRAASLSVEDLIRRFGPDMPVPAIIGRCTGCGTRVYARPDWGAQRDVPGNPGRGPKA